MIRRPPRSTRTDTLFPYTTLFRSVRFVHVDAVDAGPAQRHGPPLGPLFHLRSEERTSELQSLMRISYAVFCLKKKNIKIPHIISNRSSTTDSHKNQNRASHNHKSQHLIMPSNRYSKSNTP